MDKLNSKGRLGQPQIAYSVLPGSLQETSEPIGAVVILALRFTKVIASRSQSISDIGCLELVFRCVERLKASIDSSYKEEVFVARPTRNAKGAGGGGRVPSDVGKVG